MRRGEMLLRGALLKKVHAPQLLREMGIGAARLSLLRAVKLACECCARCGGEVTCHTAAELNIYKPNAVLGTFQFKMGPPITRFGEGVEGVKDVPPKG